MYMEHFRKPNIVLKIRMLVCQFQIFETKQIKIVVVKESMNFLCT